MSWPLSQDYNEAIQDAHGNFRDAELKSGEAVANALGIPMPRSGNFADVYELRCPSGSRWAVKCFTREIHGLRERYAEISNYLRQVNLPFMVGFQYLEEGIRVRSGWYPILKMQWVEGFVLNEFVRDNLDKKPILQALGQIWLRMSRRLHMAKLAHGDLQHGNVMFVPGSSANSLAVKLIDYDGMCVPSLAGKNSGEVGHPAYQHPERLRTAAYNQEVDRFSLLSIAAALRCLTIGGRSLWERYDTGDNLLFRQSDLQAPVESPLFRELFTISDPLAQLLVKDLYRACQGPLGKVPLLADLLLEEKSSNKTMAAAARQIAAEEGADWDFGDDETETTIIRRRPAAHGMPLWLWGAIGGAAALLLSVGVGFGLGLFPRKTADGKDRQMAPLPKIAGVDRSSLPAARPVIEGPPQKKIEQPDAWSIFDLTGDLVPDAKDPILRIPKGRTVPTKQEYSGPLDITMVVRGPLDQDIYFIAPGGAMAAFRSNRTGQGSHRLHIRRPDTPGSELGTLVFNKPFVLPDNQWYTLHWEIRANGMTVSFNKQLLFHENFRYYLDDKCPVKIRVNNVTVEVKSVVVKRLKK